MDENKYRRIDILLRGIISLGAVVAFLFSVYQYKATKEKEFKVKYWNEQLRICQDGTKYATKFVLDISNNGKVERKYIDHLYQVTFGEARLLLTDKPLETLQYIMQEASTCSYYEDISCDDSIFNAKALLFAQQCRAMLSESWNTPLNQIGEGKVWIYER
ncbi:hypothetical protein C9J12_18030 [Photobacterium frigidiphilum]|uniref:Uncharacterized protein n=1 Tax=Photobacterium frigidiphilum TaxID=264736 RepID=A0A2T3JCM3_9GAMM|nr:hypothetical protein [Photobacterium frigidiphilum]PSU46609.1 hypothetical protein C9J12_18030 [Photobacterium frigidiphilum]